VAAAWVAAVVAGLFYLVKGARLFAPLIDGLVMMILRWNVINQLPAAPVLLPTIPAPQSWIVMSAMMMDLKNVRWIALAGRDWYDAVLIDITQALRVVALGVIAAAVPKI
jgi:hypothetical protein